MNERIRELAEQATTVVEGWSDENGTTRYYEFNKEKFAELIVRECANVAFDHWYKTNQNSAKLTILKHFGVES
jgi:hypothetical protein